MSPSNLCTSCPPFLISFFHSFPLISSLHIILTSTPDLSISSSLSPSPLLLPFTVFSFLSSFFSFTPSSSSHFSPPSPSSHSPSPLLLDPLQTYAHHGVIYDMKWSKCDSYLLTASSDGTAKVN